MREPNSFDDTFFDRHDVGRIASIAIVAACVSLTLAEFAYEHHHPHFDIETSFAFNAWLGFVAFVVIVLLGRGLRRLIRRPTDYYERRDLPRPAGEPRDV